MRGHNKVALVTAEFFEGLVQRNLLEITSDPSSFVLYLVA
jgi:hypothetical protein